MQNQLENHPAAAFAGASAAGDGCAVDVAVGVEGDAFVGLASIGAAAIDNTRNYHRLTIIRESLEDENRNLKQRMPKQRM